MEDTTLLEDAIVDVLQTLLVERKTVGEVAQAILAMPEMQEIRSYVRAATRPTVWGATVPTYSEAHMEVLVKRFGYPTADWVMNGGSK